MSLDLGFESIPLVCSMGDQEGLLNKDEWFVKLAYLWYIFDSLSGDGWHAFFCWYASKRFSKIH